VVVLRSQRVTIEVIADAAFKQMSPNIKKGFPTLIETLIIAFLLWVFGRSLFLVSGFVFSIGPSWICRYWSPRSFMLAQREVIRKSKPWVQLRWIRAKRLASPFVIINFPERVAMVTNISANIISGNPTIGNLNSTHIRYLGNCWIWLLQVLWHRQIPNWS